MRCVNCDMGLELCVHEKMAAHYLNKVMVLYNGV